MGKTALLSLPYLLLFGFYFWWRLIIFPTTLSKLNYAGDFKMLGGFPGVNPGRYACPVHTRIL